MPLRYSLAEYRSQTVELMAKQQNVRAVDYVAKALAKHRKIPGDYVDVLVYYADGEVTDMEWQKFVDWQFPGLAVDFSEP